MSDSLPPTFTWPSRAEMRAVTAAWEAFMAGENRGLDKVRPVIRASWQRCHRLRVNPYLQKIPVVLSAEDLEREPERADLLSVAAPVFETVLKALDREHCLLGVSDRQGCILHFAGHPVLLQQALEVNAVPGGGTTEELIGTAMTNVVLSHGHADYMLWSEHYCRTFHAWAALGAPLHHPFTHETIGVALLAGNEPTHFYAFETIGRMVQHFEQLLHREELVRRVALLDAYNRFVLQYPRDTVLAIDGRGHVCAASSSATQLSETPQQLLGTSVLRIPGLHIEGIRPLSRPAEGRPYELQVTAQDRGAAFRATAVPVRGERQPVGTIVVLSSPGSPRRKKETTSAWRTTYTFADLIGETPVFRECLRLARQAAQQDFPALLLGESGTGKELLAQAIHAASPRRHGPFVAVNCGVANDELLMAELFGYVDGAFTGAAKGGRKGTFERADGGTLLLDEVDAMSPKMQVSLLRVLEEKQITRIGAERPIAVDVRVIAASNEDLKTAATQKRFRSDLYHRLRLFPIVLPPLRERKEDIPLLASHLLTQLGFPHLHLSDEALALLLRYAWPGNVRELRNVLLYSAQRATETTITPAALPQEVLTEAPLSPSPAPGSLHASEREWIFQALTDAGGHIPQAAARLGIHRATLYRKLKQYGLSSKMGALALVLRQRER